MLKTVPIGDVKVHPLNVRLIRLPENITRLADSIKRNGQEYPLKVVKGANGKFLCWDGGYRLGACKAAGLTRVEIDIEEIHNETELILRSFNAADKTVPLNPIEEAKIFKTLLDRLGTLDKVCNTVGRRESYISDRLTLLTLIPKAQRLVLTRKMTWLPAFRLSMKPKDIQARVLQTIEGNKPPSYKLWDIDEATHTVMGGKTKEKKNFTPPPRKHLNDSDWSCPHCGGYYTISCIGGGRHFFERR